MVDGTTGFAVDNAGNIFKTADTCDTWSDTTHNIASTASSPMAVLSLTSTNVLFGTLSGGDATIEQYNGTISSVVLAISGNYDGCLGFCKTTDGSIYCGFYDATATPNSILICRSMDNGSTWDITDLTSAVYTQTDPLKKGMTEFSSNDLLVVSSKILTKIYGYQ